VKEHRVGDFGAEAEAAVGQYEIWDLREARSSDRIEAFEFNGFFGNQLADRSEFSNAVFHAQILASPPTSPPHRWG
jgi:hypothetical protein